MNHSHLLYSARNAFVAAVLILSLGVISFFAFEPSIGRAVTSGPFSVTQEITNEISFLVNATNVTMAGTIAGITGGYATGTTVAVVRTNNATGYNMTLGFSSTTAMKLNNASSTISNYTPAVGGVPDYGWVDNSSGQAAEFGYTVRASTTSEVDPSFMSNGSTLCNTGTTESDNKCWLNPNNTPETIINTSGSVAGSTTTIKFKVAVPNAPSPALPSGFYVATGTLTAVTNP
ncbi:MAG: hypothetical protein K9M10_00650 [Candidatus Pacebacteria bacterium]|nr:hypothetical protein [Candidatus Paceibacterota bacterium]MCF7856972.1 hypothetical protein [Candidatus Paceibacterota bacterium]